jgi:integrase
METKPLFKPDPKLKLMDQVREVLRYYHYAYRTEETYCKWILRFIRFFDGKRHPKEMGKPEIERFLSHLATVDHVAPSTQNQAFNTLLFLYEKVLHIPFGKNISATRSKRRPKLPTVLTQNEVKRLFSHLKGLYPQTGRMSYSAAFI